MIDHNIDEGRGDPTSVSGFVAGAAMEKVDSARSTATRERRCMLINRMRTMVEYESLVGDETSEVVETEYERCGRGMLALLLQWLSLSGITVASWQEYRIAC